MNKQGVSKKEKLTKLLLKQLKEVNQSLKKFLLIIPTESLEEYKKPSEIKKAFNKAVKIYPPK